jgi:single stranded DNA-binding protein
MLWINRVEVVGWVHGEDAKIWHLPKKAVVARCDLVTHRHWMQEGRAARDSTFIPIEAWGPIAEKMAKWGEVGTRVFVVGWMQTQRWTVKATGRRMSRLVVMATSWQTVDKQQPPELAKMPGWAHKASQEPPEDTLEKPKTNIPY